MNADADLSVDDAFGPDNAGHDTDCDCKACLIDTWHAEVAELTEAFNTQRRVIVLQRETLQRIVTFAKKVDSLEADAFARIAREGLFPKS